jgi:hypothetical protein
MNDEDPNAIEIKLLEVSEENMVSKKKLGNIAGYK